MDKFIKDPGANLDFSWDWSPLLAEDETITEFTVTSDTPELEVGTVTGEGGTVTAWLSGGEPEQRALVTCRIVTSTGREDERSIYVLVIDR